MKWLAVWLVVQGLAGAGCFLSEGSACDHPDRVTFDCAPVEPGPATCTGTLGYGYDTKLSYPVGCRVTFPFCHKYYPDEAASCECDPLSSPPAFGCPL